MSQAQPPDPRPDDPRSRREQDVMREIEALVGWRPLRLAETEAEEPAEEEDV